MILQNQNIMIYGSDEEHSLSLIGITSGTLEFPDNATTSHHVDVSTFKFKKMLLCSDNNTDVTVDSDYTLLTYNINNLQFKQIYLQEGQGSASSVSQHIKQYAEYFPSNVRGFTLTSEVAGIGVTLYYGYNIAFFA